MSIPITKKIADRKKGSFPLNQEVTLNADGSGGPIAVAKQTKEYQYQPPPQTRKQLKKRSKQYEKYPYQKSVDKFENFNQLKDTVLNATSRNFNMNKQINNLNAKNAATYLYDKNTSDDYTITNIKGPKESASYRGPNNQITTYDLYDKEELKNSVKAVAKKKDACYYKAKKKYDVFPSAYASGYIAKCRKRKGNIK